MKAMVKHAMAVSFLFLAAIFGLSWSLVGFNVSASAAGKSFSGYSLNASLNLCTFAYAKNLINHNWKLFAAPSHLGDTIALSDVPDMVTEHFPDYY